MNQSCSYVPTLKWRQGEYKALKLLADDVKDAVSPLIEIPAIAWDFVEERPQKELSEHLAIIPVQIAENWTRKSFLDFRLLLSDPLPTEQLNDTQPVDVTGHLLTFFQLLGPMAMKTIPVTSVFRDAAFQSAVREINAAYGTGACVRLSLEDAFGQSALAKIGSVLGIPPGSIDVIVDLKSVDPNQLSLLRIVLKGMLENFSHTGYRSIAVIGSGFPIDLSEVTPGIGSINRPEWSLWVSMKNDIDGSVAFGDYAISHVDVREIDPRLMVASASIRYTAENEWLIFRGRSLRELRYGGYGQFRTLSNQVVNHPDYAGANFSWGDDYLFKCAYSLVGTGNLTTWRQVGINHHITLVVRQLASLREPSKLLA